MLDHLNPTLRSLVDEARPIGSGWIVRTWSLPSVRTRNQLRVTESRTAGKKKHGTSLTGGSACITVLCEVLQSTDGSVILGLHGPCWSCGDGHPLSLVQHAFGSLSKAGDVVRVQVLSPGYAPPGRSQGLCRAFTRRVRYRAPGEPRDRAVARHHNEPSDPGPLG